MGSLRRGFFAPAMGSPQHALHEGAVAESVFEDGLNFLVIRVFVGPTVSMARASQSASASCFTVSSTGFLYSSTDGASDQEKKRRKRERKKEKKRKKEEKERERKE